MEKKLGRWIYENQPRTSLVSDMRVQCSVCGHTRSRYDGEILNFCPRCGTDMRGEEKVIDDAFKTNGTNYEMQEGIELVRVEEPEQKKVSLPKEHGDLKDYNTLDDTIARLNEQGWGVTRYEYKRISDVLFEMPTIIEADKGDE